MLVTFSKPCLIPKMIRHVENPVIVRTVYSGIFRHFQGDSSIFSHTEGYQSIIRHTQALLKHIEPYSDIFSTA